MEIEVSSEHQRDMPIKQEISKSFENWNKNLCQLCDFYESNQPIFSSSSFLKHWSQ